MDYMTFRRLNEDFELTATVKPDKEVKIEAEGDKADELEDFARSILGDNFDFFDQDFDDEEKEEEPAEDAAEIEEISGEENETDVEECLTEGKVADFFKKKGKQILDRIKKGDYTVLDNVFSATTGKGKGYYFVTRNLDGTGAKIYKGQNPGENATTQFVQSIKDARDLAKRLSRSGAQTVLLYGYIPDDPLFKDDKGAPLVYTYVKGELKTDNTKALYQKIVDDEEIRKALGASASENTPPLPEEETPPTTETEVPPATETGTDTTTTPPAAEADSTSTTTVTETPPAAAPATPTEPAAAPTAGATETPPATETGTAVGTGTGTDAGTTTGTTRKPPRNKTQQAYDLFAAAGVNDLAAQRELLNKLKALFGGKK